MEDKKNEAKKNAETKPKMEYVPPQTTKHDPVEIVCGTCFGGGECSLYYYY
jgi:hypothetical protein